jgi:hypothetical protein
MAHSKAEDKASRGEVGNRRRPLRTDIGMAHVDVGHPCADLDVLRGGPHELRRRQRVVVDLSGEDCVEPCVTSASRATIWMSRAFQPVLGITPSASRSAMSSPFARGCTWNDCHVTFLIVMPRPRRYLFFGSHIHGDVVHPCRSYSLMHWSASDLKPSRCPLTHAKFSTSSRICSVLPE